MALIEDVLTGNIATVVVTGATAVVLPRAFPGFAVPPRLALTSGINLFIETERDAEGDIFDKLVGTTMNGVLASLSAAGTGEEPRHTSQRRANRYKHAGQDQPCYRGHVSHLKHALADAQQARSQADQDVLRRIARQIDAAWYRTPFEQEGPIPDTIREV
jgi:hypothetical protein